VSQTGQDSIFANRSESVAYHISYSYNFDQLQAFVKIIIQFVGGVENQGTAATEVCITISNVSD